MMPKIVFCDVDGTLLTSELKISEGTLYSIKSLQEKRIPFVIISARGPTGIYPLLEAYSFTCPIVCYSGSLLIDENRKVIFSEGLGRDTVRDLISFIENRKFDCTWNIFSLDSWIVKDTNDPRVRLEETIVKDRAVEGSMDMLSENAPIGKILCMCNPDAILDIEQEIRDRFPELSLSKSWDSLLEIMPPDVTKSSAVRKICEMWDISPKDAVAFGDHYNDLEMLQSVGHPFLMGNAPEELKKRVHSVTASNDQEGILKALVKIRMISKSG